MRGAGARPDPTELGSVACWILHYAGLASVCLTSFLRFDTQAVDSILMASAGKPSTLNGDQEH